MNELDRIGKVFAEKIEEPDKIIIAYAFIKAEYNDGDMYHFLTVDDQVIRVTLREEDKPE
jgi:hypothetical protein